MIKANEIEKFCLMVYKALYNFSLVNEKGKEKNQIVFIHKTRLLMKKVLRYARRLISYCDLICTDTKHYTAAENC